jgi:chemotaxis regulatin CheY-phosphate phosphatase CheZ
MLAPEPDRSHPGPADEATDFIAVPARTRTAVGELAYYLEHAMRNLREVNEHLHGSADTMPGVFRELHEIVAMTEAATVRVLEETEALVDEGQQVATLIAQAAREVPAPSAALVEADGLVARANDRAMAIMQALEFQDLTAQKIQRAFTVLEEVAVRLGKIQILVDLGQALGPAEAPRRPPAAAAPAGKSGQDLADALLLEFTE